MTAPVQQPVVVRPESSPRRFLDAQRAFYRDDRNYVPPVTCAETWQVDRRKNPFFGHGEAEFWLAWRGNELVGRISAARDRMHDELHGDKVGMFGHFEARDQATTAALLDTAASWLSAHGATSLRGPIDLSTNYRAGLFVEGEPGPPALLMPHNPATYPGLLEACGLRKAKDLLALLMRATEVDIGRLERLSARLQSRTKARVRRLDVRRMQAEIEILWSLYNRIWEQNWGFAPMSREEFLYQAKDMKPLVRPELTGIAELDGEPIGFAIGLPDIGAAIRRCDGRLLPFGWWHLLRAPARVRTMRMLTLGVLREHRQAGIDALLLHSIIRDGLELGIHQCECSWVLEDNHAMIRVTEAIGGRVYRRYRVYERSL